MKSSRRWLSSLAILFLYLGIAVLITYPLALHLGDAFAGFPYGDAYENARHMWWMAHALRTGQPVFFQPLLAYPDGIAGLTLQASPLMVFPGWLFSLVMPLPAAYNLQALLTLALNGWAMYGFARALTGRRDAALIAGVVFMSYPTLQGHLGASHLNLLVQWGVPLYAWGLWRLTQPSSRGDAVPSFVGTRNGVSDVLYIAWVAGAFLAVAWAHTIQIIYAVLPVTLFFLLLTLVRRDWRRLALGIVAAGAGALLTLLWVLPLFVDAATYSDVDGSVRYSADLLAAVTPSFFHPLWGALPQTRTVLGVSLDEGAGYVGLIAGVIALIGVWRTKAARPWLWLTFAVYILSLGPLLKLLDQVVYLQVDGYLSAVTLPWALLERLPGFGLARTPGRFNLTTGFAVAVMVAFGAAWALGQVRRAWFRGALVLLCSGLILFDYQTFFPLPTTRADIPQAIYDLRGRDDVRAVFDIPWNSLAAKDALYLQTAHELPLVHGQVTRRTPVDPAKLMILETTLDPALLDAAGADIIILHKSYVDDAERARLVAALGEPVHEDERFALFERPETDAEPAFATAISADGATAYLYAPQSGWAMLEAALTSGSGEATFALNSERIWAQAVGGDLSLRLPLALPAGYSTLHLSLEPPCPARIPPGLRCDTPTLTTTLGTFAPGTGQAAAFESGIRLNASRVVADDDAVEAWLAWIFDQPPTPTEIRYVHLLDASGALIAQVDSPPGASSTGGWSEIVTLPLPDNLPPGDYRVVVGWYRLPDVTPIGASVEIGRVTLP